VQAGHGEEQELVGSEGGLGVREKQLDADKYTTSE
jgi:hypothetical protein